MKHWWKLLIIVCFHPDLGLAQSISFSEFLEKVKSQLALPATEFPTFKAPWLDEIQLRTETREFTFDRQRYALRITPQPFGLGGIQTKLGNISAQEAKLDRQKYYAKHLKAYTEQWYKSAIFQEIITEMEREKLLLKDKKLICQRLAQKSLNDLDNYLKVQNDLYDLEQDYQTLLGKQMAIRTQWSGQFGWSTNLPLTTALLSTEKIQQFLQHSEGLWAKAVNKQEHLLALKQNSLDYELAAEKAEKNMILDYIQFRYRGPSINPWQEKMSVGISLNLPVNGQTKYDIYKLNLEKHSLSNKHQEVVIDLSNKFIELKQKITQAINTYNLITDQKAEINTLIEFLKKQPMEDLSPLLMIEQNRELCKYTIRQWEQVLNVFEQYINLLDLGGYFYPGMEFNYIETLPLE